MALRIHNLGKWKVLAPGQALPLGGEVQRRVRLDVNCPAPTRFDAVDDENQVTFLGIVQGLEVLEFHAAPGLLVTATSEDEVWYTTSDGEQVGTEDVETVSFTTLENRRSRNPELERMMQRAQENMLARQAALDAELQRREARLNAALERIERDAEKRTGTGDGSQGEPASPPAGGAGGAGTPGPADGASSEPEQDGKSAPGGELPAGKP